MYSKKVKQMVAEQIVNMLSNNVLGGNGFESFIGWLEDGDVFFAAEEYTDEEIDQAMELAREITDNLDDISWKLNVEPYSD